MSSFGFQESVSSQTKKKKWFSNVALVVYRIDLFELFLWGFLGPRSLLGIM